MQLCVVFAVIYSGPHEKTMIHQHVRMLKFRQFETRFVPIVSITFLADFVATS